ncbi:outer membrane scaffolding protein for murein synthesis (MipA/OmpV family) [Roseibium marinum]|uniref:Outer membrane scaffolding protein for murein synthesis (MipA/OmpV family) n=1 Tax=Roseibium marinum TaxID=281252 RepID=A0A2S3V4L8_9HYPH|nr:outer membrane scaffolding protein for murein synthesis (MipA/OmpV family) [Roseibium marinum]
MRNHRELILIAGFKLALISCAAGPALATDLNDADTERSKGIHGMVLLGGGVAPDFEGSTEYAAVPFAFATLRAYGVELQILGPEVALNLRPDAVFQLGPVAGYNLGRDGVSNNVVDRLDAIDGAFEVGGFAKLQFKGLLAQSDMLELSAKLMADISGGTDGARGTVGASYMVAVSERVQIGVDVSTAFATDSYMDTYFGVTSAGAARSGLPAYTASGGIKDVSIGMMANYNVTERWGVMGRMQYSRLLADAADSPIVTREGSADQFMAGVGISYSF